jgi:hypothetical protein
MRALIGARYGSSIFGCASVRVVIAVAVSMIVIVTVMSFQLRMKSPSRRLEKSWPKARGARLVILARRLTKQHYRSEVALLYSVNSLLIEGLIL